MSSENGKREEEEEEEEEEADEEEEEESLPPVVRKRKPVENTMQDISAELKLQKANENIAAAEALLKDVYYDKLEKLLAK